MRVQQNCRECPHPPRPWFCVRPPMLQGSPPPGTLAAQELFFVAQVECQVSRLGEDSGSIPSLAWLAQGPGRVGRTATLTMAAAPRSARWCGGPCSVPATPASTAHEGWAPARVSWGPRQEQGQGAWLTMGQPSERRVCHYLNSPGRLGIVCSSFEDGEMKAQRLSLMTVAVPMNSRAGISQACRP